MSKIYEALLRAEQDRAEQEKAQKDRSAGTAPELSAAAQLVTVAEPVADPPAIPAQRNAEPFVGAPVPHEPAPAPATSARAIYSAPSAAPPAPEASASAIPAAAALVAPAQSVSVAAAPVALATSAQNAAVPVAPQVPSDDGKFAPDKVSRYQWSPSADTLPALEDRGASVEQFRSLRSRMFEFRDLNKLKSIMVSSGLPQEGKSFIAANLAVSFARHKAARVLLIDGDMRRSTLHKLLGASADVGLSEYLAGTAGLLDIMQQMEIAEQHAPVLHGLASLTFIAGGSDSEKAADLSGNPRFAQLMATVSPFYDWIVVDSAPVNVVADGVNLARACDGVLLVARGGVTKYETAQRALVELKASKILGFVLNAVENSPTTGGYYGYESYDTPKK